MDIACMTDNEHLGKRVEQALAPIGQRITVYRTLASLARQLDQQHHDVVLLATELEQASQFLACRARAGAQSGPVFILLSEQDGGSGLEHALDAGADDFVAAASGLSQLETRIRACVRRRDGSSQRDVLKVGDFALDRREGAVQRDGQQIDLTHREFLLAWVLFSNEGRLISTRALADSIWGTSVDVAKRTIEQHVYRLRHKLGLGRKSPLRLEAVYGRGYRLGHSEAAPVRTPLSIHPARRFDDRPRLPHAAVVSL
jgi:DNA-binding response OmpR family regulator